MYSRVVNGTTYTFGHEGVLYRASFILYDKETKSLWVHTTGACVKGELKGKRLSFVASSVLPWKAWRTLHPGTTVLNGRAARGFMGTLNLTRRADAYGLSVGQGTAPTLYPYKDLARDIVVNGRVDGTPIVVLYDKTTKTARAYERGTRTFRWDAGALKADDGTTWDLFRALRLRDKPESAQGETTAADQVHTLKQVPATQWLQARWRGFYPQGTVYTPDR